MPHVQILGTNHFGKELHEAFKIQGSLQGVMCHIDYADNVVASFVNKIKYGYYAGNISVSIEGTPLEQFKEFQ